MTRDTTTVVELNNIFLLNLKRVAIDLLYHRKKPKPNKPHQNPNHGKELGNRRP